MNSNLISVNFAQRMKLNKTPSEREAIQMLKAEITQQREARLEVLRTEAEAMRLQMDTIIDSLDMHGFDANFAPLRSARWHKTATEASILHDLATALDNILSGNHKF